MWLPDLLARRQKEKQHQQHEQQQQQEQEQQRIGGDIGGSETVVDNDHDQDHDEAEEKDHGVHDEDDDDDDDDDYDNEYDYENRKDVGNDDDGKGGEDETEDLMTSPSQRTKSGVPPLSSWCLESTDDEDNDDDDDDDEDDNHNNNNNNKNNNRHRRHHDRHKMKKHSSRVVASSLSSSSASALPVVVTKTTMRPFDQWLQSHQPKPPQTRPQPRPHPRARSNQHQEEEEPEQVKEMEGRKNLHNNNTHNNNNNNNTHDQENNNRLSTTTTINTTTMTTKKKKKKRNQKKKNQAPTAAAPEESADSAAASGDADAVTAGGGTTTHATFAANEATNNNENNEKNENSQTKRKKPKNHTKALYKTEYDPYWSLDQCMFHYSAAVANANSNANANANATNRTNITTAATDSSNGDDAAAAASSALASDAPVRIIRGTIRVMPGKNPMASAAFVTCDRGSISRDVYLPTAHHRNRALTGDTVFVQILPTTTTTTEEGGCSERRRHQQNDADDDELDHNDIHNDIHNDNHKEPNHGANGKCIAAVPMWQDDPIQQQLWNPLVPVRTVPDVSLEENHDNHDHHDHHGAGKPKSASCQFQGRVVHVLPPKKYGISGDAAGPPLLRPLELDPTRTSGDQQHDGRNNNNNNTNNDNTGGKNRRSMQRSLPKQQQQKHQQQRPSPRRVIVGFVKQVGNHHLLTPSNGSLPQFLCPYSFDPKKTTMDEDEEKDDDAEKDGGHGGSTATISHGLYRAEYVYGSWGETHQWPPCVNIQYVGRAATVEHETIALLEENGVNHGDFHASVLKDVQDAVSSGLYYRDGDDDNGGGAATMADAAVLPPRTELSWKPSPDMLEGRRDFRPERIFTIDPTTAKDLDDALHIRRLPCGRRVEIGVHIADVSHFVRPDTAVDAEALRRATTVYLVDRVLPMLPQPLCEVACSLNENVERLAFSCVWRMNLDGTLGRQHHHHKDDHNDDHNDDEIWFGRTVIKSCARLDYATAQNIIDNKVAETKDVDELDDADIDEALWPRHRRPSRESGHSLWDVASDVRLMHAVAMARRKLRFRNGALALNGTKLTFALEEDGETPLLCGAYPIRDSNRLIEEYMLLANFLVAQRLLSATSSSSSSTSTATTTEPTTWTMRHHHHPNATAGHLALLRHHPPPSADGLPQVAALAREAKGFHIDTTSSQTLQESLHRLGQACRRRRSDDDHNDEDDDDDDDQLLLQCITELLMTPMKPAEYMIAGLFPEEEWRHFALHIPYYTHFTSPIRRYPDILVHRLLQETLDDASSAIPRERRWGEKKADDSDDDDRAAQGERQARLQFMCGHCNDKRMGSKKAQERSERVFLALYLKRHPIRHVLGVVLSVGEKTCTVFVPSLGVSAKLFFEEHKDRMDFEPIHGGGSGGGRQHKRDGGIGLESGEGNGKGNEHHTGLNRRIRLTNKKTATTGKLAAKKQTAAAAHTKRRKKAASRGQTTNPPPPPPQQQQQQQHENQAWEVLIIKVFTKLQVSVVCKERVPIDVKAMMEGPWISGGEAGGERREDGMK